MAIPGPDDYALGEIENLASSIIGKLRLIVRGSWISTVHGYVQSDMPTTRTRAELRELVQSYVNRVMGMANRPKIEPAPPPARPRPRRRKIERIPKRKRK